MSRRQTERGSRFQVEIEDGVRLAAVKFRDNDVEASVNAAFRLWWASRLRGRRFSHLIRQAREMTQARISLGRVEHGEPGQREAMPYFFAVLRELVERDPRSRDPRHSPAAKWRRYCDRIYWSGQFRADRTETVLQVLEGLSEFVIIEIAHASLRRLVGVEHHAAGNRSLAWATEPEEPLDG